MENLLSILFPNLIISKIISYIPNYNNLYVSIILERIKSISNYHYNIYYNSNITLEEISDFYQDLYRETKNIRRVQKYVRRV
jgi:uncharacterized membrane-anchored protein YitT (DUF2179 family)